MAAAAPHALVLPYPAQGHVIPLMELSHLLLHRGFRVTFVNTEFNHRRMLATSNFAGRSTVSSVGSKIRLVTIPDGLGPEEDRNDLARLTVALKRVMPGCLEEMIRSAGELAGDERFSCLVADLNMAWAIDVAKKMGLRAAAFWPASAGLLFTVLCIPKLIEDGIINEDGGAPKKEMIQLSPEMTSMDTNKLSWNYFPDSLTRKIIFQYFCSYNGSAAEAAAIICNSFHGLEPAVFSHAPHLIPIGPLPGRSGEVPASYFFPEDRPCATWLNAQPPRSVVYVAFGSLAVFNPDQFRELALGLELTGRPFLWVVRPDFAVGGGEFPSGFEERVGERGRIVAWAPQKEALEHPAVGCFVSHCGWNSTMEGVRNGVPFVCWPYFGDQFYNQSCICSAWRNGVSVVRDESGMVSREEVRRRVEEVVGDEGLRGRCVELKEMAERSAGEGGSSFQNFNWFLDLMKGV
ncbi:UDP-glycosyltransferase 83A1 [Apostasia shenzhenica]|uniref:UDP-glycosyltransferase 83A1 n=1 Tax=Apostasia shenzhenica TaxID=1088818 RepID=A0A2I0AM87_9ASPA|nr:UDP-glycosyltransferase 83A1 [Apostasia shenzhenica]